MATGRKTLSQIEDAITDVRASEKEVQLELAEMTRQRTKLIERRTNAFKDLATVRTKSALSDGIIDQADRLSHRVASILSARQKTIDAANERLSDANRHYDAQIKKAKPLHDDIENLEHELDAIAEKARTELAKDSTYTALNEQIASQRAMHENATIKANNAREDRDQKGKDYENDPLFMYLWNRHYRKSDYKPHPLIRWADDHVARLIGYNDARANYAILLEIPQRLTEHVDNLKKKLDTTNIKLETLLSDKTRQLAGDEFLKTLEDIRFQERETNESIEKLAAEMAEISTQLNSYAKGQDPSFQKAIDMSADFLEQTSYRRLVKMARTTVEPTDDEIVAQIAQIDQSRQDLIANIKDRRTKLEKLSDRREELLSVAADFRRSHYNEPGSVFTPDSDLAYILKELINGAITGSQYWDRARRRHSWRDRSADPFRRSQGSPPFSDSDFGQSWTGSSGGGRRSGGGGGGFRTGGGF